MLEVLDYLRANDFQTWIVSGGGIDFMRPWAERSTASRPGRSSAARSRSPTAPRAARRISSGSPNLLHRRQGGQAGRHRAAHWPRAGDRPGNSDGDFEMLEYVTSGDGPDPASSSTIPMPSANTPMTGTAISARSPGARRGPDGGLAADRHGQGLEGHLPVREVTCPLPTRASTATSPASPGWRAAPAASTSFPASRSAAPFPAAGRRGCGAGGSSSRKSASTCPATTSAPSTGRSPPAPAAPTSG